MHINGRLLHGVFCALLKLVHNERFGAFVCEINKIVFSALATLALATLAALVAYRCRILTVSTWQV